MGDKQQCDSACEASVACPRRLPYPAASKLVEAALSYLKLVFRLGVLVQAKRFRKNAAAPVVEQTPERSVGACPPRLQATGLASR